MSAAALRRERRASRRHIFHQVLDIDPGVGDIMQTAVGVLAEAMLDKGLDLSGDGGGNGRHLSGPVTDVQPVVFLR